MKKGFLVQTRLAARAGMVGPALFVAVFIFAVSLLCRIHNPS